jgi:hypothetical protein
MSFTYGTFFTPKMIRSSLGQPTPAPDIAHAVRMEGTDWTGVVTAMCPDRIMRLGEIPAPTRDFDTVPMTERCGLCHVAVGNPPSTKTR